MSEREIVVPAGPPGTLVDTDENESVTVVWEVSPGVVCRVPMTFPHRGRWQLQAHAWGSGYGVSVSVSFIP